MSKARLARALDGWRESLGCRVSRRLSAIIERYRGSGRSRRKTADRLLDFFLLEKAFYEIEYELAHRPDWLRVPLAGTWRILAHRRSAGRNDRASPEAYAVIEGRHSDPFHYLGPHLEGDVPVVRVFLPDARGGGRGRRPWARTRVATHS